MEMLIVYESVRSGKHAKELCDHLGQQIDPECELNLSVWSLSALQLPPLPWAAACEAERATLLIVAVNGDKCCRRQSRIASSGVRAECRPPTGRLWRTNG